jgi:hypothetical protein
LGAKDLAALLEIACLNNLLKDVHCSHCDPLRISKDEMLIQICSQVSAAENLLLPGYRYELAFV